MVFLLYIVAILVAFALERSWGYSGFIEWEMVAVLSLWFLLLAGFLHLMLYDYQKTQRLYEMCVADGNPEYYCAGILRKGFVR